VVNPWHICGPRCYWWSTGDWCKLEPAPVEVSTKGRGCQYWLCAECSDVWEVDHTECGKERGRLKLC
jgi:hypothetical protein